MLSLPVAAADSVRAYVDSTNVTSYSPFMLWIEISGSSADKLIIPDVDGIEINRKPRYSDKSSKTNFTDMSRSYFRKLGYSCEATKVGRLTIPPIQIQVGGKILKTEPVVLNVRQGTKPTLTSPVGPRSSTTGMSQKPTWEDIKRNGLFITSEVDKTEVYEGEPVHLLMKLWTIDILGVQAGMYRGKTYELPDTPGFIGEEVEQRTTYGTRSGWNYKVQEFRQTLYPTTTGELTIGQWHYPGVVIASTNRGRLNHDVDSRTDPIKINVKALPKSPEAFGGAVGKYSLEASLSRDNTIQGAPVTLSVIIEGRGNPDAVSDVRIGEMDWAYVADPEIQERSGMDPETGNKVLKKTFDYLITPLKAGKMKIPEIEFCYFDTDSDSYKTVSAGPFDLKVNSSFERERALVTGDDDDSDAGLSVRVLATDIRSITTNPGSLRATRHSVSTALAGLACPMLAYCAFSFYMMRRRRFERDTGYARSHFAKSKGRSRLGKVLDADEPAKELYTALSRFIGDKLDVSSAGITSADAGFLLRKNGVEGEVVETLVKILRACERASYASAGLSSDELSALVHGAEDVMHRIDGSLKGGRKR